MPEIQKAKGELAEDVKSLNNDFNGVIVEKELGLCSCDSVFTFQQQTMQSYETLVSLSH